MKITKIQKRYILEACHIAILYEDSFIDAYSDVHDGSEKEPIQKSEKWIGRWKKIIQQLEIKKDGECGNYIKEAAPSTDAQQLKAEIAAFVHTVVANNGECLQQNVDNFIERMRQLSAV